MRRGVVVVVLSDLRQVIFLYLLFKQICRLFLIRFIRLQVTASFLRALENTHIHTCTHPRTVLCFFVVVVYNIAKLHTSSANRLFLELTSKPG